ncbi:MAG: hypothetical protein ACRD2H_08045 [Terriglobales bacterium]
MRRHSRLLIPMLLAMALGLAAQQTGPAIRLRPRKPPATVATYSGFVQVFSHAAITLRDPHNRNALRTFSYSPALQQKLVNKHLDYGQKAKVTYRIKDEVALRLEAKWKKGS